MHQLNRGTILVVDDTPLNLKLLSEMLSKHDYKVKAAKDGFEALKVLENHKVELILLDIKMPDMDGYEVCRQVKENPATCEIPVIFISALNDTDDIVKAFEVGGVDYVTKPFKFREVLARVESQLTLTRQKKQIEELREKDRQYYETLRKIKDQFISAATHDLKNPIAIIVGYATMIKEEANGNEAMLNYVQSIRDGTNKMMTLITDMLDLAQMESGIELNISPIGLGAFLDKCTKDIIAQAISQNIHFEVIPPDEEVTIYIDVSRVERVMDNLISNAIKYSRSGDTVHVSGEVDQDQVIIQVSDSGLGIPENDLKHLFEAFFRVRQKHHMEVEGTGLGLSIVKSIVDQHGGEIYVDSELGKGSIFTIVLPQIQNSID